MPKHSGITVLSGNKKEFKRESINAYGEKVKAKMN